LKARAATAALAVTTAFTVISLGLAAVTAEPARASDTLSDVRAALKARLPKTPIDALTCEGFGGLCEVVSGNTLFYVDAAARYLLVGRLYDMETRRDVTAARLLELNPDLIAAGAARSAARTASRRMKNRQAPSRPRSISRTSCRWRRALGQSGKAPRSWSFRISSAATASA
jgi:thiol:disulfide interchange protein DsbC